VPYRGEAVRQQYGRAAAPSVAGSRSEFRGREPHFVAQPARPAVTVRAAPAARPQARVVAPEPAPRAFEGIRAGGIQTREFSARGKASMQPHVAPAPHFAPARAAPAGGGARRR
jgi:hypothetical protein